VGPGKEKKEKHFVGRMLGHFIINTNNNSRILAQHCHEVHRMYARAHAPIMDQPMIGERYAHSTFCVSWAYNELALAFASSSLTTTSCTRLNFLSLFLCWVVCARSVTFPLLKDIGRSGSDHCAPIILWERKG
jgi:hypothetical protein